MCLPLQLKGKRSCYFLYALCVESVVKFSQLKYTLSENQGTINIDVVLTGVSEMSVNIKLLLGNESSSSSSTGIGKHIELVKVTNKKKEEESYAYKL